MLVSLLIASQWVLILVLLAIILLSGPLSLNVSGGVIASIFLAFFAVGAACMVLPQKVKCEICGEPIFVQRQPISNLARKRNGFDHWATTVLDVIQLRSFTCLHCGQRYRL